MKGARVLLCVTGGIAAYKAAALTSTLVQRGALVDVIMSAHAERFVGALTFSSLTGRPVYTSLWDAPQRIPHIRLVREANVALVVPATANVLAKLAGGMADDLVTTALLAARIPVILAPAMNDAMYHNPATRANVRVLRERGFVFVDPESGFLAEREHGIGRLASEETIVQALETVLARTQSLAGKRVAVTAGPTREAFDPVRYISNPSTGTMGIAVSREAALRGADVTLILGPTHVDPPAGVRVVCVQTAQQMHDAAMEHAVGADVIVAAAAVSDWRPEVSEPHKRKKTERDIEVRLVRTPDVLAAVAQRKGDRFVVGFAAETQAHEQHAREKLARKRLDLIAVNDVSRGGFGEGANRLVLLWGTDGRRDLGAAPKLVLAARLLDCVQDMLDARGKAHAARD